MSERIDEFLFDILGLFLPGLISFTLFLLLPFTIVSNLDLNEFTQKSIKIILFFNDTKIDYKILFLLIIIASYILGHIIKIFSTIFYELGKAVVDETILTWSDKIYFRIFKRKYNDPKNALLKFFCKQLRQIIKFKAENYDPQFKNMYNITREKLTVDIRIEYFNENSEWYPFYKSAEIVSHKKGIKTKTRQFLAKYNFYRSISFISFLHLVFMLASKNCWVTESILCKYFGIIILFDIILWFTFHVKYKRYWTMCGNEAILAFYNSLIIDKFLVKE
jgi:hypothetical protein